MAYATGGKVSTEDFKKKNGKINGEGTETSDDIPAMLSDGEFVMTGQAVRGAGSFDMDSQQRHYHINAKRRRGQGQRNSAHV
jgi:hypothetical protein